MDTPISPILDTHVETPEMGVSILNDGMGPGASCSWWWIKTILDI